MTKEFHEICDKMHIDGLYKNAFYNLIDNKSNLQYHPNWCVILHLRFFIADCIHMSDKLFHWVNDIFSGVGTCGSPVLRGTGEPAGSTRYKEFWGTAENREPAWGTEVWNRVEPWTGRGTEV